MGKVKTWHIQKHGLTTCKMCGSKVASQFTDNRECGHCTMARSLHGATRANRRNFSKIKRSMWKGIR